MTTVNPIPDLAQYIKQNTEIPAGTRGHLWVIAAAWADTTVEALLADTSPVRAVHYEAAVRVEAALAALDHHHEAQADKGKRTSTVLEDLRASAALLGKAAAAQPFKSSSTAADWARASSQVYDACVTIARLRPVKGL